MELQNLKENAKLLRKHVIEMLYESKSGHPGGSLSCADIINYLYFEKMNISLENFKTIERDHFILSKGHAAPILYAALAEKGFFPKEELLKLRKLGARLQGHPDSKQINGVDVSTGSLGQGFSNAVGVALGMKSESLKGKVYVLLGDGELQEGLVWEAAMCSAHYKLDNLVVIIDNNGLQIDGRNEEVMNIYPLKDKFKSFGFNVLECDGHDYYALEEAFKEENIVKDKPTVVICKTIKGKGVSFMENEAGWHGQAPNKEEKEAAMAMLS